MSTLTQLFTDCRLCDGVGCKACRPLCPICVIGYEANRATAQRVEGWFSPPEVRTANPGGRYCDAHDPSCCPLPL